MVVAVLIELESLPLPDGWVAYRDEDDARFFYCETSKTSVYRHPNEALFQARIAAERKRLAESIHSQIDAKPVASEEAQVKHFETVTRQAAEVTLEALSQTLGPKTKMSRVR